MGNMCPIWGGVSKEERLTQLEMQRDKQSRRIKTLEAQAKHALRKNQRAKAEQLRSELTTCLIALEAIVDAIEQVKSNRVLTESTTAVENALSLVKSTRSSDQTEMHMRLTEASSRLVAMREQRTDTEMACADEMTDRDMGDPLKALSDLLKRSKYTTQAARHQHREEEAEQEAEVSEGDDVTDESDIEEPEEEEDSESISSAVASLLGAPSRPPGRPGSGKPGPPSADPIVASQVRAQVADLFA